ncbi:MAG: VWA domain-containing protein [Betaproteobacteria bacterium]
MQRMPWLAVLLSCTAFLFSSTAVAQTCNTADRSVLLILDASGSMNAKLPNGETRMAVAQRAIKGVAGFVPAQAQLSLRMYGAQSAASQKNCQDTHPAVPFGPASASGGAITSTVDGARAQGYTPIAYSLGQAVNDFAAGAKERVIVLVSDGKETCQGDPVLAAKALAAAGITVHTVGFVVDSAARGQLQAIARLTGGTYFDAPVGPELPDTLKSALNACKKRVVTLPSKPQPGKLRTTSAIYPHEILNAETGANVATFDRMRTQVDLPAGIYEVKFGPGSWKGIEVRSGETTTITPGELHVEANVFVNADVVDSETGEKHGTFNNVVTRLTLMPGVYDLRFRNAQWRYVKVDGGKPTVLRPAAVILADGLKWKSARVTTSVGTEVFRFDAVTWKAALPPGDYIVEIDGNTFPFPATEGEEFVVKPQ